MPRPAVSTRRSGNGNRFDVYLAGLDAVPSKDAKNTWPDAWSSPPNEMNAHLASVMIAPLSSVTTKYPTRIAVNFLNNERMIVSIQIRTVDKVRLVKKIGEYRQIGTQGNDRSASRNVCVVIRFFLCVLLLGDFALGSFFNAKSRRPQRKEQEVQALWGLAFVHRLSISLRLASSSVLPSRFSSSSMYLNR